MSARKAARRPKARPISRRRQRELTARAHDMVRQMRNTPGAVLATLNRRPHKNWRTGLPDIAAAAFSDAFAGFCAVYIVRNGRTTIGNLQQAFLGAMRRELESREQAERGGK